MVIAKRVYDAYFAAYDMYISKEAELKEIEDRIEPEKLNSLREESKSRGFGQFGAASQSGKQLSFGHEVLETDPDVQ